MDKRQILGKSNINLRVNKKRKIMPKGTFTYSSDFVAGLYKKCARYEEIEDMFGYDFEVIIKLRKQGYFYDADGNRMQIKLVGIEPNTLPYIEYYLSVTKTVITRIEVLKDYKHTWWLKKDKSE